MALVFCDFRRTTIAGVFIARFPPVRVEVVVIEKLSTALLDIEKWGAKIFAVSESFVYRFAANWTLSKLARCLENL